MEWKLMLENRENVRVARLFGEDTAKFLKDSMKSLSEQLFSLPKIIEKNIQESETLVDKIQLEKKTLGKEVKNSKNKGETEISSSTSKSTDNAEADKIFKTASNSLSEYFEQKKKEEEKKKKEEENKLKEIKKYNETMAEKRREQKHKKKEKKEKQKEVIKEYGDVDRDNMEYDNYKGRSNNNKPSIYKLYAEDIEKEIDNDKDVQSMLKQYGLEETLDLMSILNIDTGTLNEKTVKMIKQAYAENLNKLEDNPYRDISGRYYDYEQKPQDI